MLPHRAIAAGGAGGPGNPRSRLATEKDASDLRVFCDRRPATCDRIRALTTYSSPFLSSPAFPLSGGRLLLPRSAPPLIFVPSGDEYGRRSRLSFSSFDEELLFRSPRWGFSLTIWRKKHGQLTDLELQ